MIVIRVPRPALRPFVRLLWTVEPDRGSAPAPDSHPRARVAAAAREQVLPTASMHLVFRLSDHPLRLFAGPDDSSGQTVGHGIVGGARDGPYVRDISERVTSVGAQLHAGASELLFGVPASELAHRHTPLDALWGARAGEMRERLCEARSADARLDLFESMLAERLPHMRGLHPAVAQALEQFAMSPDVREAVRRSGYSHRRFAELFRDAVGLGPKVYCRVQRFAALLETVAARPTMSWAGIAIEAGYSDQPHLTREFGQLAGMTPREYRRAAPRQPHHVALPSRPVTTLGLAANRVNSVQDASGPGRVCFLSNEEV